MKNMHKMLRILEVIWLVIGIIGVVAFIYAMIAGSREQAIYFLVFTFVSGVMYAIRKRQRVRAQVPNSEAEKNI